MLRARGPGVASCSPWRSDSLIAIVGSGGAAACDVARSPGNHHIVLARLYTHTAPRARVLAAALALVCGGAVGNLLDRLRNARGVVDFIDVGVGAHRFWIFNTADAAITLGVLLLALVLAQGEREAARNP